MKCPKCKIEIDPKATICPSCSTRLTIKCPRCHNEARIGTSSCKSCGFVFVKFCESCGSANYVSAKQCRKCFHEFKVEKQEEKQIEEVKEIVEEIKEQNSEEQTNEKVLNSEKIAIVIDFMSLPKTFQKFEDNEFREKVILNIKTSVKLAFGVNCEFLAPQFAVLNYNYSKQSGLTDKIQVFRDEFRKFGEILSETLGEDIFYKIIIAKKDKNNSQDIIEKLNFGIAGDIIVSNSLYETLKDEMNLIKVSQDAYKVVKKEEEVIKRDVEEIEDSVALNKISSVIQNSKSKIDAISINAPRGVGKTHLLTSLQAKFQGEEIIFLKGQCSALTQISPIGLVQDIFITLFNLSFTSNKHEKKLKEIRNILTKAISKNPDIKGDQIETLINLLYPVKEDIYENILVNKSKTFADLMMILEIIKANNRVVMMIDDFDLIDETSYEFLKYLVENNFFTKGTKLIISYRRDFSILNQLAPEKLNKHNILDISLAPKTLSELSSFILDKFKLEKTISGEVLSQIINNARGNFAYVEQVLSHMEDVGVISTDGSGYEFNEKFNDYFVAPTFEEIIKLRFNHLKKHSQNAFNLLGLASFLGGKFNQNSLLKTLELTEAEFEEAAVSLMRKNFITRPYQNTYIFKNNLVWTYIYELAREDKNLKALGKEFLNNIMHLTVTTPGIKALLAEQTGNRQMTFELWTQSLKLASFIGDIGLYITSQKQSANNLDVGYKNAEVAKKNIAERLGKLIYLKNPNESINYLADAINNAQKEENTPKVVELTGYLITSASLIQNYHGVVEAVDNIIKLYKGPKFTLERALVKSRKLNALNKIGDWEEVISIVNNEINPLLQNYLKKPKKIDFATYKDIYDTWLYSNIQLAESYIWQGSGVADELLKDLEKEIFKSKNSSNKAENTNVKVAFLLVSALNYSLLGFIKTSDEILQTIVKDYSWAIDDSLVVSKWNFVDILNKIFSNEYENIGEELFNAVTFANNCGDDFNKNIFKALLGYIFLKDENMMKALNIAQEQMTYFSNEKLALGALLSWYISAKASYNSQKIDEAINICEKSLKISQSAKINCAYFSAIFQMLLSKCYLAKGDEESAKMYNEMAIEITNQNDIPMLRMFAYEIRAKIMQEGLMRIEEAKKIDFAKKTLRIIEKSYNIARAIDIDFYVEYFKREITSFKAFCKLNNLEEPKRVIRR